MAQKSSIKALPREIRAAADAALKEGATIDQVVEVLAKLGAEVSRSAVGRYKQEVNKIGERIQRAREISTIFVEKLGAAPDGRQGRLITELMQTVVFDFLAPVGEGEAPKVDPQEIMMLSRAIKDLASAEKISADRLMKIEADLIARQKRQLQEIEADEAKRGGGVADPEATLRRVRQDIYGLYDQ